MRIMPAFQDILLICQNKANSIILTGLFTDAIVVNIYCNYLSSG